MKLPRRKFLHLAAGVAALPAVSRMSWAQGYPSRPVRFIVPLAPGGGTDFVARLLAEYLTRALGQQVVVENKPGAGGMLGVETAAKSPSDGHTVLIATDSVASAPHTMRVNTDYVKELVPVIALTRSPLVLAVHPSLNVTSVSELIRVAKSRPGLGYATSGVGTQQHFAAEWFAQIAGIKLGHAPYRGADQAVNDLLAGHVPIGFLGPTLIPHHKAGTLQLIAQASKARSVVLPDVPTFQETGLDGLVIEVWYGAFVPSGTSGTVVTRLNAEIGHALANPTTRASLLQSAQEPIGGTPASLSDIVREDSAKYERLARELNIKAE
jgi:tripartite-type tricarboxylate transporter receptor subunit TctC